MANTNPKPLTDDIPLTRAWKTGRRIYIRCGYNSRLNTELRNIGATWDGEQRALWVGTVKTDKAIPLIRAAEQRGAEIDAIKALGLWVKIPYEAADIRDRAHQLGAVFDKPLRQWAAPTPDAHRELLALVEKYAKAAAEARRAEQEKARAEAAEDDQARRRRIITEAGRTPTGETATLTEISTAFMNKAAAYAAARPVGEIVKLTDGRRGIITAVKVWFTNDTMASSVCWHSETHDEAHWDWRYDLAIVEPTDEETAADAEAAAKARDLEEIRQLVDDAQAAMAVERDADRDGYTPLTADEIAGEISLTTGGVQPFDSGRLILTNDGTMYWQHPGYYDDYRRTEGVIRDLSILDRFLAVLDKGSRTRTHRDQLPTRYDVTPR